MDRCVAISSLFIRFAEISEDVKKTILLQLSSLSLNDTTVSVELSPVKHMLDSTSDDIQLDPNSSMGDVIISMSQLWSSNKKIYGSIYQLGYDLSRVYQRFKSAESSSSDNSKLGQSRGQLSSSFHSKN